MNNPHQNAMDRASGEDGRAFAGQGFHQPIGFRFGPRINTDRRFVQQLDPFFTGQPAAKNYRPMISPGEKPRDGPRVWQADIQRAGLGHGAGLRTACHLLCSAW